MMLMSVGIIMLLNNFCQYDKVFTNSLIKCELLIKELYPLNLPT